MKSFVLPLSAATIVLSVSLTAIPATAAETTTAETAAAETAAAPEPQAGPAARESASAAETDLSAPAFLLGAALLGVGFLDWRRRRTGIA